MCISSFSRVTFIPVLLDMSSSVSDIETRPSSKMAPRTKNKKRTQSKSASQGEIEESGDFVGESCAGDIDESDPWEDIDMRDGREGLLFRRASKKRVLKRRDLTPKEREAKELKKLRFQEWLRTFSPSHLPLPHPSFPNCPKSKSTRSSRYPLPWSSPAKALPYRNTAIGCQIPYFR